MNTPQEKNSKCCGAKVHVEGGDEGTNLYVCDKCDKACDVSHSEPKESSEEKVICVRCGKTMRKWFNNQIFTGFHCDTCGGSKPVSEEKEKETKIYTCKKCKVDTIFKICPFCTPVTPPSNSKSEWETEFEKAFMIERAFNEGLDKAKSIISGVMKK